MELTSKQRRWLRGKAHGLDAFVRVGKDGVSEAVVGRLEQELDQHELVKVRFSADRDERTAQTEALAVATGAAVAGTIGRVAILYRQHPDPEERRYELPA